MGSDHPPPVKLKGFVNSMTHDNDQDGKAASFREDREPGRSATDDTGLTADRRRDALRKILAGGGIVVGAESLPGNWSKPLIDSVVLPAHAQTTGDVATTPAPTTTFTSTTTTEV